MVRSNLPTLSSRPEWEATSMGNVPSYSLSCLSFTIVFQTLSKGAKSSIAGSFEEFFGIAASSIASARIDIV